MIHKLTRICRNGTSFWAWKRSLYEQRMKLPDGVLGTLVGGIKISDDVPREIVELWTKYSAGQIGSFDFLKEVEGIRNRQTAKPASIDI